MKTSLNELALIEEFLLDSPGNEEKLLMQARLILQPGLKESLYLQKKTYELANIYGREKLRKEITQVHQQLFTDLRHRTFRERIVQFFAK
jgi:hypothetical protein